MKNALHGFLCVQNDSWRWTRVQRHEQGKFTTTPREWVFVRVVNKFGDMCVFRPSIPRQSATRLVLDHTGFEEVAFFLEVDHLAHPWERVFFVGEEGL
ncbi:MAG: hypothetical protein RLZ00_473 [Pseudomonadota bacterium]